MADAGVPICAFKRDNYEVYFLKCNDKRDVKDVKEREKSEACER